MKQSYQNGKKKERKEKKKKVLFKGTKWGMINRQSDINQSEEIRKSDRLQGLDGIIKRGISDRD